MITKIKHKKWFQRHSVDEAAKKLHELEQRINENKPQLKDMATASGLQCDDGDETANSESLQPVVMASFTCAIDAGITRAVRDTWCHLEQESCKLKPAFLKLVNDDHIMDAGEKCSISTRSEFRQKMKGNTNKTIYNRRYDDRYEPGSLGTGRGAN